MVSSVNVLKISTRKGREKMMDVVVVYVREDVEKNVGPLTKVVWMRKFQELVALSQGSKPGVRWVSVTGIDLVGITIEIPIAEEEEQEKDKMMDRILLWIKKEAFDTAITDSIAIGVATETPSQSISVI